MALSERSRSVLYRRLIDTIDDPEAVGEMLSHFPSRDIDEPASRDYVQAEAILIRSEIAVIHGEIGHIRSDITEMKSDITGLHSEIASVKSDITGLHSEIASVKSDITGLHSEIASVKSDVANLTVITTGLSDRIDEVKGELSADLADMRADLASSQRWNIVTLIALASLVIGAIRI